METSAVQSTRPRAISAGEWAWPRERTLVLLALTAILVLAALLRFANLAALGYANHYYSAAVTAMLQSWHNFFFAAAEPGGSVSVDKPPVGLWIETISAFFLGVNTLGVLLPELLAGILSVLVIYHLVQRSLGPFAGLVAALALAVTPVAVATDRNNTIDSILILVLLLAAWAFIRATESGRLRFLLLGALLVGVGFNVKMLQAFLPLPGFYALYFLGGKERLLAKIWRLALATAVLLVVSLSWAVIVDLVPASQRPYVGSSSDNSEISLIVGYNGLQRLMGMGFGQGGRINVSSIASVFSRLLPSGNSGSANAPAQGRTGAFGGNGGFRAPNGIGGGFNTGQAGLARLFKAPLSKEASWMLPFGLIGALLMLLLTRLRWPIAPQHQAVVLWGGWLLAGGAFFSVAGFFHPYYLSMLGPAVAALVGIGVAAVWRLRQKRWWLALPVLMLAAGLTFVLQMQTAQANLRTAWWLPLALGLAAVGVVLFASAGRKLDALARIGLTLAMTAMLITPAVWSGLTMLRSSSNQSLPAAYDGQFTGPGRLSGAQVNQTLLTYLQANTQGMKYLMAVPSSMQGADYVLATGRPVLYLGGFDGQDKVTTSASLAAMVARGELRFIYWDGQGGGRGGFGGQQQPEISSWVTSACRLVQGYDAATQNAGAPDGVGGSTTRGFGGMQVTLYDCAPQVQ